MKLFLQGFHGIFSILKFFIMKYSIYIIVLMICLPLTSFNQSIRKDYRDMTEDEKDALVKLFKLKTDLINDLGDFHERNFRAIHFNVRDNNPNDDVFFAWHRFMIFELEQEMQKHYPCISIPYWDWTTDNSTSSALWDNDFLGWFDANWGLGRNLGSGSPLPTQAQVDNVQAITNWLTYVDAVESGPVHTRGHTWVGGVNGVMSSGESPKDPIFYLHHGMVDKLWQDWEDKPNTTSSYVKTNMPRYDGTYTFNNVVLPSINPNSITDSRSLGVFFAENELATMDNYTVSNTTHTPETFFYQFEIDIQDNFEVPPTTEMEVQSLNKIVLKEGFIAKAGSKVILKIGECDFSVYGRGVAPGVINISNDLTPVYELTPKNNTEDDFLPNVAITPNSIKIESVNDKLIKNIKIYTLSGQLIDNKIINQLEVGEFNIEKLPNGSYVCYILYDDGSTFSKLFFK